MPLLAIAAGLGAGLIGIRRFLKRRYREIYASADPEFQDPVVLPGLQSTGGIG